MNRTTLVKLIESRRGLMGLEVSGYHKETATINAGMLLHFAKEPRRRGQSIMGTLEFSVCSKQLFKSSISVEKRDTVIHTDNGLVIIIEAGKMPVVEDDVYNILEALADEIGEDAFSISVADNGRDFEVKACYEYMNMSDLVDYCEKHGMDIDHLEDVTDEHPIRGELDTAEWARYYITI